MKKTLYLYSNFKFGKYRRSPDRVENIINSGIDGLNYMKWIIANSWTFKISKEVEDYIKIKEVEYGCVLQKERGQ